MTSIPDDVRNNGLLPWSYFQGGQCFHHRDFAPALHQQCSLRYFWYRLLLNYVSLLAPPLGYADPSKPCQIWFQKDLVLGTKSKKISPSRSSIPSWIFLWAIEARPLVRIHRGNTRLMMKIVSSSYASLDSAEDPLYVLRDPPYAKRKATGPWAQGTLRTRLSWRHSPSLVIEG